MYQPLIVINAAAQGEKHLTNAGQATVAGHYLAVGANRAEKTKRFRVGVQL